MAPANSSSSAGSGNHQLPRADSLTPMRLRLTAASSLQGAGYNGDQSPVVVGLSRAHQSPAQPSHWCALTRRQHVAWHAQIDLLVYHNRGGPPCGGAEHVCRQHRGLAQDWHACQCICICRPTPADLRHPPPTFGIGPARLLRGCSPAGACGKHAGMQTCGPSGPREREGHAERTSHAQQELEGRLRALAALLDWVVVAVLDDATVGAATIV